MGLLTYDPRPTILGEGRFYQNMVDRHTQLYYQRLQVKYDAILWVAKKILPHLQIALSKEIEAGNKGLAWQYLIRILTEALEICSKNTHKPYITEALEPRLKESLERDTKKALEACAKEAKEAQ